MYPTEMTPEERQAFKRAFDADFERMKKQRAVEIEAKYAAAATRKRRRRSISEISDSDEPTHDRRAAAARRRRTRHEREEREESEQSEPEEQTQAPRKPQLLRSSKGDAKPRRLSGAPVESGEIVEAVEPRTTLNAEIPQSLDESTDTLAGWRARKEPLRKRSEQRSSGDRAPTNDATERVQLRKKPSAYAFPSKRANDFWKGQPATKQTANPPSTSNIASAEVSKLPKIPKRQGSSSKETERAEIIEISERPPAWYKKLNGTNTRNTADSGASFVLAGIKKGMKDAKRDAEHPSVFEGVLETLARYLHLAPFEQVSEQLLRNQRMLHNTDGLPQIFDPAYNDSVRYPVWLQADATELYNKWCRRNFETDMFWGLIAPKPATKRSPAVVASVTSQLSSSFHGNGLLLNGQWWPLQLCLLRDGAHGQSQQGIHGKKGEGAYSCVIAGGLAPDGAPYPNIDEGDTVYYCGTDSKDGTVTEGTSRLVESQQNGKPVRLIRSHNLKNEYAPEKGFRYDGLYKVVSFEKLDPSKPLQQRHRFRLERVLGQPPMRGTGPGKRPTKQELEWLDKHKQNSGFA
ncbi:hypothetical protein B0A50_00771 [Salinomyces thailandicus]|uniref:YDG domain-containing protein n=1 Tax=Salinomyces thailandicus TaxID=706561 RepID=A0A4U0UCP5_9PEZI|nr:hypothetical protein B0A50_00771 [Salinomyces thailandica]